MTITCQSTRDALLPPPSALRPEASTRLQRLLILSLPMCMLISWLATLATGQNRLDGLGNPVGGDFAMFYVAAQMAASGELSGLYDEPLQQTRLLQLIPELPESTYLPYRYPPLVAIVAARLAYLPYEIAFLLFTCTSISMWLLSIHQLVRTFIPRFDIAKGDLATGTAIVAIAAAPVMLQTLIDGQASAWWFAIAAGCWCCLQRQRPVAAGCLLALAACKPNVMLLLGIVLVLRFPRMLIGIIATGCVMLAATLLVAGVDCLSAYVDLSKQLAISPWRVETPYWKVQSLLTWSELFFGPVARSVNLAVGLCAASCIGLWWRQQPSNPLTSAHALSAALVVNALFNPYTPIYDLTLLCLGLFACVAASSVQAMPRMTSSWLERRDVQCSMAVILLGPILSQGFCKATEWSLQPMPIALLGVLAYWLIRSSAEGIHVKRPVAIGI